MIAINNEIMHSLEDCESKISRLAIISFVLGLIGTANFGPMLYLLFYGYSYHSLLSTSPPVSIFFSCIIWVLGATFGKHSLVQIAKSGGQIRGKRFAVAGLVISGAWLLLIILSVFYPAVLYINS